MVNRLGIDTAMMDHQPRNHRRLVCDIVRMLGAHQSVLLVMNKLGGEDDTHCHLCKCRNLWHTAEVR